MFARKPAAGCALHASLVSRRDEHRLPGFVSVVTMVDTGYAVQLAARCACQLHTACRQMLAHSAPARVANQSLLLPRW